MAWEDMETKLAQYRAMEYGGDEQADKVIANYRGTVYVGDDAMSLATIPTQYREDCEAALDYRMDACANLSASKAWTPDMLRRS